MKKIFFIVLASIILLFFLVYSISKNALPNWAGFYEIKRLEEKVLFSFQSTDDKKTEYMKLLLQKRLEELQRVVKNKNYDIYYKTNLRYGTQAGELTDFIIAKNLKNERKSTIVLFQKHKQEIQKLLKEENNQDKLKYIQDSVNYLNIYSAKLSK